MSNFEGHKLISQAGAGGRKICRFELQLFSPGHLHRWDAHCTHWQRRWLHVGAFPAKALACRSPAQKRENSVHTGAGLSLMLQSVKAAAGAPTPFLSAPFAWESLPTVSEDSARRRCLVTKPGGPVSFLAHVCTGERPFSQVSFVLGTQAAVCTPSSLLPLCLNWCHSATVLPSFQCLPAVARTGQHALRRVGCSGGSRPAVPQDNLACASVVHPSLRQECWRCMWLLAFRRLFGFFPNLSPLHFTASTCNLLAGASYLPSWPSTRMLARRRGDHRLVY